MNVHADAPSRCILLAFRPGQRVMDAPVNRTMRASPHHREAVCAVVAVARAMLRSSSMTHATQLLLIPLVVLACGNDSSTAPSNTADGGVVDGQGHQGDGAPQDSSLPDVPVGEVIHFEDGLEPIALEVRDPVNVTRRQAPVTGGLPFARGALQPSDVERLVLADDQGRRLTTFQPPTILGTWSDGSVKWLLLDFQATLTAGGASSFTLGLADADDSQDERIDVTEETDAYVVDTGVIRVRLSKTHFSLFEEVRVDADGDGEFSEEERVVAAPGDMFVDLDDAAPGAPDAGAYEYPDTWYLGMEGGNWLRDSTTSSSTRYLASAGDYELSIQREGKSHVVFKLDGWHRAEGGNRQFGKYSLYLHFYVGQGFVRATHTWTMTGDPNKNFIRRMALEVPMAGEVEGAPLDYAFGGGYETEGSPVTFDPSDPPYVPIVAGPSEVLAGQVDADGQVSLLSIGPDKYYHDVPLEATEPVEFTLLEDGEPGATGVRPSGWGRVHNQHLGITAGVRDFWREHPKEVQYRNGKIGVYLWPDHGAKTLDLRRRYGEVRGTVAQGWGKAARREFVEPGSAVGVAKTTDVLFSFHGAGRSTGETDDEFRSFQDPLMPFATGQYNVSTGVFGPLIAYDPEGFEKLERYMDLMASRIVRSREEYGWYGMMDVGDYL